MAFNVNELRYNSFNPLLRPIASPAYFEAYFDSIPKVFMDSGDMINLSLFGKSSIGSKLNSVLNAGLQEVKERVFGIGPATNVRFRVQAADLPQRQLETQPRFANGPQRMVPHGAIYSTTVIEVIESDQYEMRKYFDEWMKLAHGQDNAYRVKYYDDIIAPTFVIIAYSANGLMQAKWTLKDVYPIAVNSSQMNWSSTNEYVTIPVELVFHEWDYEEISLLDNLTDPAFVARAGISAVLSNVL